MVVFALRSVGGSPSPAELSFSMASASASATDTSSGSSSCSPVEAFPDVFMRIPPYRQWLRTPSVMVRTASSMARQGRGCRRSSPALDRPMVNELLVTASASDRRGGKRTVSLVGWHRQGHLALTLRVFVRDFRARPGSLAQWQRIGLLIRWFWVRVPGDPQQTPAQANARSCRQRWRRRASYARGPSRPRE